MPLFDHRRPGMENNMQHAPVCGDIRFGRSVKQQRPHQKGVPCARETTYLSVRGNPIGNPGSFDDAKTVGSRRDSQWPIVFLAHIQMQPDSQHLFKHLTRRPREIDTSLYTSQSKARGGYAACKWENEILMPRDIPINLSRLVESDGFSLTKHF